ncbi:MAG: fumarylacetoacetate hydrolase family protein [Bacteroidota bacterium]
MQRYLYHTTQGAIAVRGTHAVRIPEAWPALVIRDDLHLYLDAHLADGEHASLPDPSEWLAPLGAQQEVWAAGVTYYRSRTARMEESAEAGGGSFYDRVYAAPRPELFFKATPQRVANPGAPLNLRPDSQWMVPEPELGLLITPSGTITGYTVGNDLSCRDLEGENPLYLPQAKTFDGCASLGPCLLVSDTAPSASTPIRMAIERDGAAVFEDATTLVQLKRSLGELRDYLFAACSFPHGVVLLTGTGIVPPDHFALAPGDRIHIAIDGIGTLTNTVRAWPK